MKKKSKESVIKGLECLVGMPRCDTCPYVKNPKRDYCLNEIGRDAISLLKNSVSQECVDQIRWERDILLEQLKEIGKGFAEKMDDVAKIVRCKDCKHSDTFDLPPCFGGANSGTYCTKLGNPVDNDFFCAHGEVKEK